MSQRRFLLIRDLDWQWFNVLTFGVFGREEGLRQGLRVLEEMREAALGYCRQTEGWSANVGLFFHVYAHSSVNSLHLHILDLDRLGPTYAKLDFKNLPLDCAVRTLQYELENFEGVDNAEERETLLARRSSRAGKDSENRRKDDAAS